MERRRAWLYCRAANGWDTDATDYLNLQKIQLEQFCHEHDLIIAGNSLVTGNGKREIQDLVQNGIDQNLFDVLVVLSISRIGRDFLGVAQLAETLSEHEKGFCFVRENLCTLPGLLTENNESQEIGGMTL